MRLTFALFLLFFVSSALLSQIDPSVNCDSATTTYELRVCGSRKLLAAQIEMINVFSSIRQKLAVLHREALADSIDDDNYAQVESLLVRSQAQWEDHSNTMRELFESLFEGGSLAPIVGLEKAEEMTRYRISSLKAFLRQLEP